MTKMIDRVTRVETKRSKKQNQTKSPDIRESLSLADLLQTQVLRMY